MTIVFKHEEFVTDSGQRMFIEQYADKPHFVKLWRYGAAGFYGRVFSSGLLTKPRKKRLIESY